MCFYNQAMGQAEKSNHETGEESDPKTFGAYTTIEGQNVQKAIDIFSRPMVAALEALRRRQISGFMGSEEIIAFMLKFIKWFEIHDVSNLTQAILKSFPNKAFNSTFNERLQWLKGFLKWPKDRKNSVTGKDDFLTSETYEAITNTTKSTIAKIKFLLNEAGFQFVLTRKFNSDNLERKFSALRQANGRNYNNMDTKAAIYGIEKLLRTGITYSAVGCNVPISREKQQRGNKNYYV
ncbi:hypothetical protein DAPPUDRAFT_328791 [Daphnia pulex]|uniref:Transposable element P transposase n=1 Tax=Daphnia pulex TaxID=6669 RepID=E9HES6_DAPPU|nr:hypothetical protein DAPPUDRAFT_328791 [Daphnia pulex]|eukprot:EFX69761.1 hypothetical protein DAPPUDRAFT_328791 [Daphnia pulex]